MIDANNIMGAIIAGGQATRMNKENKALKLLAGKPLAEHIASRLAPSVSTLIFNANRDANEFSAIGKNILAQNVEIISDVVDLGAGPLAGLLQSLLYARETNYSYLATVAGDTPFFPADLVPRLAKAALDENTLIIAKSGGFPQPIFGLWPVSLVDDLNNWLSAGNTNKVMAWVRTHSHRFVEFEEMDGLDPFFNINTPDDLEAAEHIISKETA